jgi:hypothetical protein
MLGFLILSVSDGLGINLILLFVNLIKRFLEARGFKFSILFSVTFAATLAQQMSNISLPYYFEFVG